MTTLKIKIENKIASYTLDKLKALWIETDRLMDVKRGADYIALADVRGVIMDLMQNRMTEDEFEAFMFSDEHCY